FTGNKHSYYINPKMDMPIVCYAQPNLYVDNLAWGSEHDLDGPNWVVNKGFKVLEVSNPAENFPTTGSNNLRFYLLLGGISPGQVIAANGTTVSPVSGSGVSLSLSEENTPNWEWEGGAKNIYPGGDVALKIVLKGPEINSINKRFSPSLFKLYSDSSHTKLLYSFKIERWYIAQQGEAGGYTNAQNFCHDLGNGYRLPDINDYTNANGNYWLGGISGRNINNYQRRLSYREGSHWVGGIFNEWGWISRINFYPDSDWDSNGFWVSRSYGNNQYVIYCDLGYVHYGNPSYIPYRVACVTP
ncbi:hypothetical protein, partial [Gilliamella sp. BG6]|uniref:hypothetical protein n=1 Tax=unclassified Gilliamella TaxID=2685620 RepID=UPI003986FB5E